MIQPLAYQSQANNTNNAFVNVSNTRVQRSFSPHGFTCSQLYLSNNSAVFSPCCVGFRNITSFTRQRPYSSTQAQPNQSQQMESHWRRQTNSHILEVLLAQMKPPIKTSTCGWGRHSVLLQSSFPSGGQNSLD